jgi:hypothetical protein
MLRFGCFDTQYICMGFHIVRKQNWPPKFQLIAHWTKNVEQFWKSTILAKIIVDSSRGIQIPALPNTGNTYVQKQQFLTPPAPPRINNL